MTVAPAWPARPPAGSSEDLAAEVVARQAADAAHVAALDPHGDRGYANALFGGFSPTLNVFQAIGGRLCAPRVGSYYAGDTLATTNRAGGSTQDKLVLAPLYVHENMTLDKFHVNVTAGLATAVYRMGLWHLDNQAEPFDWASNAQWATLVADLGTVDCSAIGVKTITSPQALTQGWYAIGGAHQIALATLTLGSVGNGVHTPLGSLGTSAVAASASAGAIALAATGIAGAFAAGFTPNAGAFQVGHGVGYQRTA